MPEIVAAASYATFINVFRCKPVDQDEVVRINTEIIDRVAMRMPGFISASVHRSTDGTRVFNYLQWESPEHLVLMQASPEFAPPPGRAGADRDHLLGSTAFDQATLPALMY